MSSTNTDRVLLAFFSRPGENYWRGGRRHLDVGNTDALAHLIRERIDCDVFHIEASEPYPQDYDETVERNVREQDADGRPAIAGSLPDPRGYSTVILASPIWNGRPPMIMSTFVESVDLTGTTILPVVTYAVSGLGRTAEVYRGLAPGATLGEALAVRGDEVADAAPVVTDWLACTLPSR